MIITRQILAAPGIKPSLEVPRIDPSSWASRTLAYGFAFHEGAGPFFEIKSRTAGAIDPFSPGSWVTTPRGAGIHNAWGIDTGITSNALSSGSLSIALGISKFTSTSTTTNFSFVNKMVSGAAYTDPNVEYQLHTASTTLYWENAGSPTGGNWTNFTSHINDGRFHVVILTDNGANSEVFVDGVSLGASGTLVLGNANANPLYIGNDGAGADGNEPTDAVFEFAYFFSKALTAPQRQQITRDPYSILKGPTVRRYAVSLASSGSGTAAAAAAAVTTSASGAVSVGGGATGIEFSPDFSRDFNSALRVVEFSSAFSNSFDAVSGSPVPATGTAAATLSAVAAAGAGGTINRTPVAGTTAAAAAAAGGVVRNRATIAARPAATVAAASQSVVSTILGGAGRPGSTAGFVTMFAGTNPAGGPTVAGAQAAATGGASYPGSTGATTGAAKAAATGAVRDPATIAARTAAAAIGSSSSVVQNRAAVSATAAGLVAAGTGRSGQGGNISAAPAATRAVAAAVVRNRAVVAPRLAAAAATAAGLVRIRGSGATFLGFPHASAGGVARLVGTGTGRTASVRAAANGSTILSGNYADPFPIQLTNTLYIKEQTSILRMTWDSDVLPLSVP